MSRLSLWVAGIALLLGTNVVAQDRPTEFEVGVDYSLVHFIPALTNSNAHNLNGGGGSLANGAVHFSALIAVIAGTF